MIIFRHRFSSFHWICLFILLLTANTLYAYTVSNLNGFYRNGQVFLTWTNPAAVHLEYKVYRSSNEITDASQLTVAAYMGFVRDSSAFNIRKTKLQGANNFFVIDPSQVPLNASQGLYVATAHNGNYFYAVTVVDLTTSTEDKTINVGNNSLQNSISQSVDEPQPVLQDTFVDVTNAIHEEYAMWGDNQAAGSYPAFNNAGSYGYNFTIFKRGNYAGQSLYILVRDDDPFSTDQIGNTCNDCNLLKMDDWLPNGNNTYWTGYNAGYDIYSNSNPVWESGTVNFYTQARVRKTIQWVRRHKDVDSNKVYASGFSHNGFGAMLMGQLNTDQIAAVYATVPPILVRAEDSTFRETQWCDDTINLLSDFIDPRTGQPDSVYNVMDNRFMDRLHYNDYTTYMQGVNGKNDTTVGWVEFFGWYDSLNATRAGGIWFWDQRYHDGTNANFTPAETTPNYERFSLKKSYPAFSNCSINQDPGSGLDSTTGDPYGALNGYLDWSDASIQDSSCKYSITCFVKNFYVGGKLAPGQYDSCTVDLTIRRQQNFHPHIGSFITWELKNSKQQIVQQGDFFYEGGAIILTGLKIYRDSSYISFTDENCGVVTAVSANEKPKISVMPVSGGYEMVLVAPEAFSSSLAIFDEAGRMVRNESHPFQQGQNTFFIRSLPHGIFFLRILSENFSTVIPLTFTAR